MGILSRATRLLWSLIVLIGTLGLITYLAYVGWREFGPRKPAVNSIRRELAEQLLPTIVTDLQKRATNVSSAVLLHLAGDPSDFVSDRLRSQLSESGVFQLTEPTLDEKLQRSLNLPITSPATLDEAVARARGLGAPAVLFGSVREFEGTAAGGRLELELTLADIGSKEVYFTQTYQRDWKPQPLDPVTLVEPSGRLSLVSRLLGWALVVLLLPVFTIHFLRATVRRGSNRANFGVLALYTAVAAMLAWLVVGATPTSLMSTLVLIGLTALAFGYHVWIMTVALRLEEP